MKVLIVDDSPQALALARARLAEEDVDIICADGGEAGLHAAEEHKPDLILLDVDMPELSGFDVCRALKNDNKLDLIPVIFLSGSDEAQAKITGLELGAVDYVTKPFDAFELRARVRAALRTKRLQDMLIEKAHIDPLTGLSNRLAMMEKLDQEWNRTLRHGRSLSFVMIDVDFFKQVNDTYGHVVGDRLLQGFGRSIMASCRNIDLPARYGGEEFAIIVPDAPAQQAAMLAQRCRAAISQVAVPVGENTVQATASFGVADTELARSQDELLQAADAALYQCKHSGRNSVCIATENCLQTQAGRK